MTTDALLSWPRTEPSPADPPLVLHHYTGASGLLGIVQEQQIWATHALYQNDGRELRLALDAILEYADSTFDRSEREYDVFATLPHVFFGRHWHPAASPMVFMSSFSEHDDALSQWRGYGTSPGNGYALGFNRARLVATVGNVNSATGHDWELRKVSYDTTELHSWAAQRADDAVAYDKREFATAQATPNHPWDSPVTPGAARLAAYLLQDGPLFKDPAFAEEQEWRLISRRGAEMLAAQLVKYREGQSSLLPYVRFPLMKATDPAEIASSTGSPISPSGDPPSPLQQIRIGPGADSNLSSTAVSMLVDGLGVDVLQSTISYRSV